MSEDKRKIEINFGLGDLGFWIMFFVLFVLLWGKPDLYDALVNHYNGKCTVEKPEPLTKLS